MSETHGVTVWDLLGLFAIVSAIWPPHFLAKSGSTHNMQTQTHRVAGDTIYGLAFSVGSQPRCQHCRSLLQRLLPYQAIVLFRESWGHKLAVMPPCRTLARKDI